MKNDRIQDLKRQYDEIPVPEEAKDRILLGIRQAQEEKAEQKKEKEL